MKLMVLNARFYIMTLGLVAYYLVWRLIFVDKTVISLVMAMIYTLLIIYLYRSELKLIAGKLKKTKKVQDDQTQEA